MTVYDLGLVLTKVVDQPLVLSGTEVTYTYTLVNTGTVPLRKPGGAQAHDWIVDARGPTGTCAPVAYQSGDANNDFLLAPNSGETWTYQCDAKINQDALNTATVVAETDTATPNG